MVNTLGVITDTANWIKIEGSFIAKGNEQFLTIGNFKDNAHTAYVNLPYNIFQGSIDGTRYLIDDVSVVESNTVADAGPDTHVGKGGSVYIGRPMSSAIWGDWTILGSSTIIGSGPGITVSPLVTTRYVVTQTLCGNVTKDTVKVEVWAAGVPAVNGQTQTYSVAPNPNNASFEIVQSVGFDEQASIVVLDAVGRRVYTAEAAFRNGRAGVDAGCLPAGLYYLSLKTKDGYVSNLRFVRQ